MTSLVTPNEQVERKMKGQILAMFALMLTVLIGMVGVAIDLTHVRTVADEIQRAADSGALAGVVYLPEAVTSTVAEQAANAAAAANGFPNGGTTQITEVPNSSLRRLKVVIRAQVATPFLGILGLGSMSVTRSAVASYGDPVPMGAPDHMLGFAPFPTDAFNNINGLAGFYPQGFYLQLKGSYGGLEHGDAFSPYFETSQWSTNCTNQSGNTVPAYSGNCNEHLVNTDGSLKTYNDACGAATSGSPYNDICTENGGSTTHTMVHNPYYNQQNGSNGQTGYNYIFTLPPGMTHSVLLKVNDPLDECALDTKSTISPVPAPSSTVRYKYDGAEAHIAGGTIGVGGTYKDSAGNTKNAGDWTTVHGLLDGQSNSGTLLSVSTMRVDQCDTTYWDQYRPNTLQFTLYPPTARTAENVNAAPANATTQGQDSVATVTTGYNPIEAGPEWKAQSPYNATCKTDYNFQSNGSGKTCFVTGAHAFQWLTIGKAINTGPVPAYIRVNVQSVLNSAYWGSDPNNPFASYGQADSSTYATGGNVFSLAICDIGSAPDAISGNTQADTDPGTYGDIFKASDWEAADLSGLHPDLGCPDPNADGGISTAGPSFRFQVNGREAMCIITLSTIPNGSTSVTDVIPLAEIGSRFHGSDITIRLFDPGDVSGADNYLSILDPSADPSSSDYTGGNFTSNQYNTANGNAAYAYTSGNSYRSYPYRLSISSPPGSHYSDSGTARPPWWCGPSGPGGTSSDYDADVSPAPLGTLAQCPPVGQNRIDQGVHVADPNYNDPVTGNRYSNDFANDVWLEFHVSLPPTYSAADGKDWWKVAYNLVGGAANDTTTWQVLSGAAPVNLISG